SYAFGLFSDTLKDELGFSQSNVDIIASVGELGLWSSFVVGLMLERISPRQVYVVGSAASALGLGYVSLAIGKILPTNPAAMAAMFYLANFGTACYAQTAQSTAVRNFPAADRGKVSGLIKSVFGLSSAVLSVLYTGLLGAEHVGRFLLLLSVGVPLLGMVSSVPLNLVPAKHLSYSIERAQGVSPRLTPFYVWFAVVTLFLMASVAVVFFPFALPVPWTGIFLVIVVLSVSGLPLLYGRVYVRGNVFGHSRDSSSTSTNFGVEPDPRNAGDATDSVTADLPLEEDLFGGELFPLLGSTDGLGAGRNADIESCSLTWEQCLRDKRFWVLFVSFLCGAGSGLVVINNIASIAASLEMTSSTLLVTALGISNALGRITAGWVSDRIVSAGLPRSLLYCGMLLLTSGVDFLLAAGIKSLLYPLSVMAGLCYGSMFALVLALTGDLFGAEHIGTNYGLLDLGPAVGSFVFATGVVNLFYNRGQVTPDCIGPECFGGTFLCTAVACLCACGIVYFVLVRPGFKARMRRAQL
ncbi:unnamed protein product, partial [Laminaria digitata]